MPLFEYKGINRQGKNIRGSIDADNVRSAKLKLKKDNIYVISIQDKQREDSKKKRGQSSFAHQKVGVDDLSLMTRQLATLIKAHIPLVDALGAVSDQVENHTLKEALADCRSQVNEGSPFYRALAKYPKIFNHIYVSMCEAGEMSGTLDVILLRLAEFTESQSALVARIKSAMIYPVIMIVFSLGFLGFLFVYLVPKISMIFADDDTLEMPWITKVIIEISGFMVNYWIAILISTVVFILIFLRWKRSPAGSAQWDAISLEIPFFGLMTRMIAISRFTRTLATLLTGGVPMLNALDIVRNVVNNAVLAKAISNARDNISEGESIAQPLKKSRQFPPLVIHMISIGEKTGELEHMLTQVSDAYDFQVKTKVDGMTSILNPVMIILMGSVIFIIVLAVMLPMFEMLNTMQ